MRKAGKTVKCQKLAVLEEEIIIYIAVLVSEQK